MRTLTVVFASAAALSLSLSSPMAQTYGPAAAVPGPFYPSDIAPTPPYPSTTGQAVRSPEVSRQGANSLASCPPVQRKKGGKASAFRC